MQIFVVQIGFNFVLDSPTHIFENNGASVKINKAFKVKPCCWNVNIF